MKTFLVLLLTVLPLTAAFSPDNPIDEVKLKDGTVLHHVRIVSFSPEVVMARWDGGRGTIKFADMPDELKAQLAPWRPEERATAAPLPRVTNVEIPTDVQRHVDEIFSRIPKMDSTKIETIHGKIGPTRILRGQCFVTTKGGQNYKLGGVTVQIFGKKEFEIYQAELRRRNADRLKALDVESNAALARHEYAMSSALLEMGLSDFYDRWDALPASDYSVETDADGNFALTHRVAGDYVVFARATREVFDKTERYVWRVDSSKIANPERFFLTNSNMD